MKQSQHVIFPGVIFADTEDLADFIAHLPESLKSAINHRGRNMRIPLCHKYESEHTFHITRHSIPGQPDYLDNWLHSLIHVRTTCFGTLISPFQQSRWLPSLISITTILKLWQISLPYRITPFLQNEFIIMKIKHQHFVAVRNFN